MVGQTIITAGILTSVRHLFTRDKRTFISAILEDFGGSLEITAWADIYERTKDLWQEGNTLLVKGKVKARNDQPQLTCLNVKEYKPKKHESTDYHIPPEDNTVSGRLRISFHASDDSEADIKRLQQVFDVLSAFPGDYSVFLTVISDKQADKLELPQLFVAHSEELIDKLSALISREHISFE